MKLIIVFGLYKELYAGQAAPAALAVTTEYDHEDNPDWIEEELQKAKSDPEMLAVEVFEIDLGSQAIAQIRARLLDPAKLEGKII